MANLVISNPSRLFSLRVWTQYAPRDPSKGGGPGKFGPLKLVAIVLPLQSFDVAPSEYHRAVVALSPLDVDANEVSAISLSVPRTVRVRTLRPVLDAKRKATAEYVYDPGAAAQTIPASSERQDLWLAPSTRIEISTVAS